MGEIRLPTISDEEASSSSASSSMTASSSKKYKWRIPKNKQSKNIQKLKYIVFHKKYEVVKILGKGAYGHVLRVKDKKTGIEHAIKFMKVEEEMTKSFLSEVTIPSSLEHPNIISYDEINIYKLTRNELGLEDGRPIKAFGVSMPIMDGDLDDVLKTDRTTFYKIFGKSGDTSLRKRRYAQIFFQLIIAMGYLRMRNVLHCDIKLPNIFFTETNNKNIPIRVVIGDFGISQNKFCNRSDPQVDGNYVFTLPNRAPELVISGIEGVPAKYSFETDTWAIGICFMELLNLGSVFSDVFSEAKTADVALRMIYKQQRAGMVENLFLGTQNDFYDLVDSMLKFSPILRKTPFELINEDCFDDVRDEMIEWYMSQNVQILASKDCLSKVITNFVPTKKEIVKNELRKIIIGHNPQEPGWAFEVKDRLSINAQSFVLAIDHFNRFDAINNLDRDVMRPSAKCILAALLYICSKVYNSGDKVYDIDAYSIIADDVYAPHEIFACAFNLLKFMDFNLGIATLYDAIAATVAKVDGYSILKILGNLEVSTRIYHNSHSLEKFQENVRILTDGENKRTRSTHSDYDDQPKKPITASASSSEK